MMFPHRLAAALLVASLSGPALATPAFTCNAKGESWSVTGGAGRPADCSVTCLLTDPQGDHDRVVCAARLSGTAGDATICEGSQLGRRWTSAAVLLSQCSYGQP